MLAFTNAYFSESGLFNGLQPIQIKNFFRSASDHAQVVFDPVADLFQRRRGRPPQDLPRGKHNTGFRFLQNNVEASPVRDREEAERPTWRSGAGAPALDPWIASRPLAMTSPILQQIEPASRQTDIHEIVILPGRGNIKTITDAVHT